MNLLRQTIGCSCSRWRFLLRRWHALVPVVTAFAVAEAITLSPSSNLSLDTLWFQPLIGLLIATSIIYMGD